PGPPPGGTPDGLEVRVLRVGDGPVARSGDVVKAHYTGWLYDEREPGRQGAEFDSSRPRGEPLVFVLGQGRVIPPHQPLLFEVELVGIDAAP
ncbi:MAG: FKBP-type peptidyl-prolyl cis-trans isomerase, partial [Xanthomonadaceae bacterium]|nr:FKBP-type peptidyl-prolyl cis-trans isomerase [Xanthomonadaceae bacterium]